MAPIVFTWDVDKSTLSTNNDETMQSIDSLEIYLPGIGKGLLRKNEESKYNNIINQFYRNICIWSKQRPSM